MSAAATPLGVLALGVGGGLIYAAVTGQSPMDELRKALTTGRLDGAPASRAVKVEGPAINAQGGTSAGGSYGPQLAQSDAPDDPTDLVPIGQGPHRLIPSAAAAFAQAQQNYGAPIYVTDSYRSSETQAAGNARDPGRFASATSSAHVEGRAVDVNLGRTTGGQSRKGQPQYDKLAAAMNRAGWYSYTGGTSGDTWHFSFGVVK